MSIPTQTSSDPYGMTDEQANAIIARYAPNWRTYLALDGKIVDELLDAVSFDRRLLRKVTPELLERRRVRRAEYMRKLMKGKRHGIKVGNMSV